MAGLAISAFTPMIASGTVFSTRRMNSGADAIAQNNPFVGIMNMDIAAGQVANAAKGVANIARESTNSLSKGITSAEESIKALSNEGKFMKGASKVVNYTADHINPIICATGAVKVICADDKQDALIHEGLGLGTMFLFEAQAKKFLGMPKNQKFNKNTMEIKPDGIYKIKGNNKELLAKTGEYNIKNGRLIITREGTYKNNPFAKKQAEALHDYCATKKLFNKVSMKAAPGVLKGLLFVCASIGGYKLGNAVADVISPSKAQKQVA